MDENQLRITSHVSLIRIVNKDQGVDWELTPQIAQCPRRTFYTIKITSTRLYGTVISGLLSGNDCVYDWHEHSYCLLLTCQGDCCQKSSAMNHGWERNHWITNLSLSLAFSITFLKFIIFIRRHFFSFFYFVLFLLRLLLSHVILSLSNILMSSIFSLVF